MGAVDDVGCGIAAADGLADADDAGGVVAPGVDLVGDDDCVAVAGSGLEDDDAAGCDAAADVGLADEDDAGGVVTPDAGVVFAGDDDCAAIAESGLDEDDAAGCDAAAGVDDVVGCDTAGDVDLAATGEGLAASFFVADAFPAVDDELTATWDPETGVAADAAFEVVVAALAGPGETGLDAAAGEGFFASACAGFLAAVGCDDDVAGDVGDAGGFTLDGDIGFVGDWLTTGDAGERGGDSAEATFLPAFLSACSFATQFDTPIHSPRTCAMVSFTLAGSSCSMAKQTIRRARCRTSRLGTGK